MTVRIGINGFGRIGRAVFRAAYHPQNREHFQVVHINNLSGVDMSAHLLRHDSVHGLFSPPITAHENAGKTHWSVAGDSIHWTHHREAQNIPWKEADVDVVMECSGVFTRGEDTFKHLHGGAPRVLISAPAQPVDLTVVYGVNHDSIQGHERVISNASCTTNCLAVAAKVMVEHFDIVHGSMTTVHAYTNDQRLLDSAHSDWRRARGAQQSIIPTTTGAARTVGKVLPQLADKIHGIAIRVPVANVSLCDVVWELTEPTTAQQVNERLQAAAQGALQGILDFSDEPLVSSDYCGSSHSAVVDGLLTEVIDDRLCKMVLWYDNEVAFSWRMLDVAKAWMQKQKGL